MNSYTGPKTICFFIFLTGSIFSFSQTRPLNNAHSHNDYRQLHPLSDALNNGFTSIEADVFLIHNELIVSHTHPFFKNNTLESLYLKPLKDSIDLHHGNVYENYNEPLILLIDIKTDATATYAALQKLFEKYHSILTEYSNGKIIDRAVTIILTGNKPYKELENEKYRLAFIDQSLLSIDKNISKDLCPLASTKYSNVIKWKGKGSIPPEEKEKLVGLIQAAHLQGKKVRLWASPENKKVWKELLDCGIDLINTDKLEELKLFLTENK